MFGALGALIFVLWRARKKSKELTRKNAILADRSSAYGASARIEQVMRDRTSVQPQPISARSATSINTTDVETLVGGGRDGYRGLRHSQGYAGSREEEYYGKYPDSYVGSSSVDHYRDEQGQGRAREDEGEYYGKYEESGVGTIDTYEQGVRDSYAEGKEEEHHERPERSERPERVSYYGPDGVKRYGREF